jgi:8-oxo-dGTP pyrophosphatase MutT (NUDIX family)
MKIEEVSSKFKAGVIPYFKDNDEVRMMFMVPSNPAFGGALFQIAKGGIDRGESAQQAALREGNEELGLELDNIKSLRKIWSGNIVGNDDSYNLTVFIAEINYPAAFGMPHYETGQREWLTAAEFAATGRPNHRAIVKKAVEIIG